MTRHQLSDNNDTLQKAQRRFVLTVVWAGLIFSCFALVLLKAFRRRIIVAEIGALFLIAAVAADLFRLWRRRVILGLVCPKCHDIFREEKLQGVIVTGKCRKCGTRILDD